MNTTKKIRVSTTKVPISSNGIWSLSSFRTLKTLAPEFRLLKRTSARSDFFRIFEISIGEIDPSMRRLRGSISTIQTDDFLLFCILICNEEPAAQVEQFIWRCIIASLTSLGNSSAEIIYIIKKHKKSLLLNSSKIANRSKGCKIK